jgi:Ca-activated chloride channel family protein
VTWSEPVWLHALWAIPLLALFVWQAARAGERALSRFADRALLPRLMPGRSLRRKVFRWTFLLLALASVIAALARPRWGSRMEVLKRRGVDVVVVLDTSLSMLAEDIKPNRLERARQEIQAFLEKLRGDRVGIVPFAGSALVLCPLTLDYGAASMFLDSVHAGMIPEPGTALEAALDRALEVFDESEGKHRAIVLVTDGEGLEGDPIAAAERVAEAGVVVHAIGVGGRRGEPIPLRDENGELEGFKKDESGQVVLTRLDDAVLQRIAFTTGGSYHPAGAGGLELDAIYEKIASLEAREREGQVVERRPERFQAFLLLGVLLLGVEVLLPERRSEGEHWEGRFA